MENFQKTRVENSDSDGDDNNLHKSPVRRAVR